MTRRGFALSLTAGSRAAFAQTAGARARTLVDKVIYALGGDAFRNMQTRTEIGRAYSFYNEQLSGLSIARLYTKYLQPAQGQAGSGPLAGQAQRQVYGKKEEEAVLFTPDGAWDVTFRGAKPLADDKVNQFRETALHDFFYILRQRLIEPGVEFDSRGSDVIENQPVQTLDVFDAENRKVTVWIHSSTFLPVKQSFLRWDPLLKDRREEVTRYSKYRDVGNGVMWPFATERERDGEKLFQLFSERVSVGDTLPDSLFQLPAGIRILKK